VDYSLFLYDHFYKYNPCIKISLEVYANARLAFIDMDRRIQFRIRIPQNVIQFIDKDTKEHPCFYLDELQAALKETMPERADCPSVVVQYSFA
jgi:hypothetical protein